MTDETAASGAPPRTTAGALLRAARERQGLHIVALAAQMKVPQARLEALEGDRYDELPDTTFTRALAQTLCRVLKTDPVPVLALLPGAPPSRLEQVDAGLNTPFRDRPGRVADPAQWVPWRRPVPWAVGALLVAAAAFVLVPMRVDLSVPPPGAKASMPASVMPPPSSDGPPLAQPPGEPAAVATPGAAAVPPVAGASAAMPAAGASAPVAAVDDGNKAVLRALQDTWVQASDAGGQVLLSRLIPAGETVEFSGQLPLKVRVGNVAGTELSFRGQPVNLKTGRDNVVTVSLP